MVSTGKVAHNSGDGFRRPVPIGVRVEQGMKSVDYFAEPNLGSTDFKRLEASAQFFDAHQRGVIPPTDSSSLSLGRKWHDLLDLGPDVFGNRSVVVPDQYCTGSGALSTKKDAKEWLASLPEDAITLTPEESGQLGRMWDGFQNNGASWDIYENLKHQEISIFWEWGGVPVKCRPDAITHSGQLVDWKSTREGNPLKDFRKAVANFGYGISAALYEEGCRVAGLADPPMYFVATSTVSYETQVMTLPKTYVTECRDKLLKLLAEYVTRTEENHWLPTGYGDIHEIEMWGHSNTKERIL